MKPSGGIKRRRGFTLIELLVATLVSALIAAVALAMFANAKRRSGSICCNCNLKQIAISFKTWAWDNTNVFPMAISTNLGGTREYLATSETFRHFQVMSNELASTVLLICPQDKRARSKSFGQEFTNSSVSYFVGAVDNNEKPQMFLAGDRHLTGGKALPSGIIEFTTNDIPNWNLRLGHRTFGNVALADGSVQGFSAQGLQTALLNTGSPTNQLAMP